MKGAGKNPFAMSLCLFELLGPCRFAGWKDGEIQAEPHWSAWVQTAAVNLAQTRNAMTLVPAMLSPKAIAEYQVDIGKEVVYAHRGRCRLEAVTSSPRALEGGRATFIVLDETHHWLANNEGHAMAAVITRNAAKSRDGASRTLAITNAHAPGEDSVAERDYDAWRLGSPDFLYDSLEAPDDVDLSDDESVRAGLEAARGDSHWLDPDRILAEIRDPRTSAAVAYRFYLNKIHAEEDKPFDREKWAKNARPGYRVPDGSLIVLGFDGSVNRDHTALIGTEVATGHQWVVGYWEPRLKVTGEMVIDIDSVEASVQDAFERYEVWRMYADPYKWGERLSRWAGRYGSNRVVSWSTTLYRKMALSLAQYREEINAGTLTHDGDPRFTASIHNSHKHMQNFRDDDGELMWLIQKERMDSPLKIDAAVAGDLSAQARRDAIADGALEEQTIGVTWA